MIKQFHTIFTKEVAAYFNSNLVYILLAFYALLSMLSTFIVGNFFDVDNSGLFSFFYFQDYVFMVLIPALTMRLWADERKSGTIEFLLTQPVSLTTIVLGKFCAAWFMCLIMFVITFPFWIYIGLSFPLDNLNILAAYTGCWLVAGAFCAIGCMISAFNNSPVNSYIITLFLTWSLIIGNFDLVIKKGTLSNEINSRIMQSLNFNKHYYDLLTGQISVDNIIYYLCLIVFALWLNVVAIEYKKN